MKKILIGLCILSSMSYSSIIKVSQKIEEKSNEIIYDFSKINNNKFIYIKSINNKIYIINKQYITSIKINKSNKIYIDFFGENESMSLHIFIHQIEVHQDSYDTIYKFLNNKGEIRCLCNHH